MVWASFTAAETAVGHPKLTIIYWRIDIAIYTPCDLASARAEKIANLAAGL